MPLNPNQPGAQSGTANLTTNAAGSNMPPGLSGPRGDLNYLHFILINLKFHLILTNFLRGKKLCYLNRILMKAVVGFHIFGQVFSNLSCI